MEKDLLWPLGLLVLGLFVAGGMTRWLLRLDLQGPPSKRLRLGYNLASTAQALAITIAIGAVGAHVWLKAMQQGTLRFIGLAAICIVVVALFVGYSTRKAFLERLESKD